MLRAVVVGMGLLLMGTQAAAQIRQQPAPSPPTLAPQTVQAIRATLRERLGDDAQGLKVSAGRGVVIIAGSVSTLPARDLALDVAAGVRGVQRIADRIRVDPIPIPDATIRQDVEAALVDNPDSGQFEVSVTVYDGVVTLEGDVDSWGQHDVSLEIARRAPGVRDVVDLVDVKPPVGRADAEILRDVLERFGTAARLDSSRIGVMVDDGVVYLNGWLHTLQIRTRAWRLAHVAGVRRVDAGLLRVDAAATETAP